MEKWAICSAMAPGALSGMVHVCRRGSIPGPCPRRPSSVSTHHRVHKIAARKEAVDEGLPKKPPYATFYAYMLAMAPTSQLSIATYQLLVCCPCLLS